MALRLVLTLLALRIATSTSLPSPAPGPLDAPKVDALVSDASANGRKLDAVSDAEDEPIALLIGKDVKRVMRRKGSDGNAKVARRREQHKDLESHLLESHEWSPRDSELERILDPVSLEDPKDIELKKAIAQLLKEVADREEKRRHKQHHDSNEGNSKESDDKIPHEDLNISTEHEQQELKTSQDNLSDGVTIENHDEIDDNVDSAIDKIEDSNDSEFRSSSIDVEDDSKLNDDDFEPTESDLDDPENRTSHESRNAPKKEELLKHDDHHDEKHTNVHHDVDNDLKHKVNHHNHHHHISKEIIEEETDDENHHVNIDNITLEQSLDSFSGDKSEALEHDVDSEEEAHPKNGNNHKHHSYERSSYHDDVVGELSHENENILKSKAQEVDRSHQDHGNDIKTEQKDNEIHKDSQNENSYEDISDQGNHDEENDDDEPDQTEEFEDYHDSNSQLYSFENYDILNEDSDEKEHPKDQAQKTSSIHSDVSSEDDNDFIISHRSHDDSKEETENDSKDDVNSRNPANGALKVIVDHHKDSIEIVSHSLPKRRRLRKNDRIRKSYRRANRKGPTKQYTLSFFLKK